MKNLDLKHVITNIRNIREGYAYSQEYMGVKLGIGQNAYSKIELGKSKLTLEKLFGIAAILETDIFHLLKKEMADRITDQAKIEI